MARKVDEAIETLDSAAFEFTKAARLIIRYGNIGDMEELDERIEAIVNTAMGLYMQRSGEGVQNRHGREIDRIVARGIANGVDPADFKALFAEPEG